MITILSLFFNSRFFLTVYDILLIRTPFVQRDIIQYGEVPLERPSSIILMDWLFSRHSIFIDLVTKYNNIIMTSFTIK